MKIVVVSDNHGNRKVIEYILNKHQDADYYFHLGDSEEDVNELKPFCSVKGNNDYDINLPMEKIISIGKHNILLIHGHSFSGDPILLAKYAKNCDCDIVIFGHLHEFINQTYSGINVFNPGSCYHNRYGFKPTYAILEITDDNIDFQKIELNLNEILV